MRQVILDTETTGLEVQGGHRIIEVGAVEVVDRKLSGQTFQRYINPEREIDDEAQAVHGISLSFLADKPRFADIWDDFYRFVAGAELVIHNAPFDVVFLNAEIQRLAKNKAVGRIEEGCTIVDSLVLARRLHPGQKNNLDALCRRYSIDNTQRELHGALLDAEILAEVYLQMTGGQTQLFGADPSAKPRQEGGERPETSSTSESLTLQVVRASPAEQAAHEAMLDLLADAGGAPPLWRR